MHITHVHIHTHAWSLPAAPSAPTKVGEPSIGHSDAIFRLAPKWFLILVAASLPSLVVGKDTSRNILFMKTFFCVLYQKHSSKQKSERKIEMHHEIAFFWAQLADFYVVWILVNFSHRSGAAANRRQAESPHNPVTVFPSFALTVLFFPILLHRLLGPLLRGHSSIIFIYFISERFTTPVSHISWNLQSIHNQEAFFPFLSCSAFPRSQKYLLHILLRVEGRPDCFVFFLMNQSIYPDDLTLQFSQI